MIAKYVHEYATDWDLCLDDIQLQYNIRPQETLGFSPFEMIFGQKPRLPATMVSNELHEYLDERKARINQRQNKVVKRRRTIQRAKMRSIKTKILVGDVVFYKNLFRKNKLDDKWSGPYIVVKAFDCEIFK